MTDAPSETLIDGNAPEQAISLPETEVVAPVDSSPAEVETQSDTVDTTQAETKQDSVQLRINSITAKMYDEKRRADELEARLNAKPAQAAPEVTGNEPVYPEITYDSEIDRESLRKYNAELIAYQRADAEAQYTRREQEQAQTQAAAARSQVISTYQQNAIADQVDINQLKAAEAALNSAGISPELGNYLMGDKHGGKLAVYLFENPEELQSLLSLDPISAGIKIATEVKARALSTVPASTQAPDPIPVITGGGMQAKDELDRLYPGVKIY